MLGAQAVNAEAVPFSGRVDHNLLLHFWQVVVLTFVPQVVTRRTRRSSGSATSWRSPTSPTSAGSAIDFPEILESLEPGDPRRTPARARIDLPDQACLEVLRRLKDEAEKEAESVGRTGTGERRGPIGPRPASPSRSRDDRDRATRPSSRARPGGPSATASARSSRTT